MTPKSTKFSDMANVQTNTMGPLPYPNSSYFNISTNSIDPDKRKVYQRDINNVMRGYDPTTTKSIGGKSTYLYDAAGDTTKLKL